MKNIIITGASSGIGYELALRYVRKEGHQVFAIARRKERLHRLREACERELLVPVAMDLASLDFSPLTGMLKKNNVTSVDLLVHNAGMLVLKPFEHIEKEEWEAVYRTNVMVPALMTRALLAWLGQGVDPSHVLMIGSMGGLQGTVKFPGLAAYSSSKGALVILTEMLAAEWGHRNIRVNGIAPGSVQTEMLEKAFPGFRAAMTAEAAAAFIGDFGMEGWRYFNGKTLPMATGTP